MKATIYARFSSDNQREESITAQVRACTEYAQKQGYTIVKVYTDEAKSANTDDRPGFMQMISDIKTNRLQVDVLLIHKLDRFARNRYDSAFYKRELKRAEVRVESVLEHLDDSPESILMESIFEGMAEYYSKNLAREVMKGMKETALQGKHTGGLAPLGLSVDKEGYYIINKLEAEAIRIIFNMFHQGHGYSNIQGELNKKGLKTKLGRPFSKNSIHDILRNKKYAGIYVFNRASSKSPDGRRNNHKSKSREEVIEIKGAIPAIIPSEIFWEVQAKMDKNQRQNSKGSYKSKTVYILSGVIWCGECGKRMVGTSSSYLTRVSREHRKQYYYECNYGKRTGACGNGKIRKDLAENYVLSELEARLLNDLAIPELAHKISIHYKQEKMKSAGEGLFLEQELLKVDKQINNLVQAITEGGATVRVIVEQLKRLEAKKSSLESRLQEWRIKQSQDLLSENTIASYLQHYRELLKSDDPVSCKQLVEEFVERVTINKDTIKVTFKVSVDTSGKLGEYRCHSQ